ncbi:MAG TPA: response regulator transcription factor [Terriglobia bacterium]|nr:response regulator transcription factor [Terriglobia bacterium]
MIRVLIAGESEMVRRGLESVVASASSLEVVSSVGDLSELNASVREVAPDVVLVSVESSLEEFLQETAAASADDSLQPALVALIPESAAISPVGLMDTGITALLPRDATAEEIVAAINAAAVGLVVVHPAMTHREGGRPEIHRFTYANPAPQLTARELEILRMVAGGLANKEIAWQLKISEHTVKFHLSSIFTKLDVSSRAEAVSLGFRMGLILI